MAADTKLYRGLNLLPFHTVTGTNVILSQYEEVAKRRSAAKLQAYIFTAEPVPVNEKFVIRVGEINDLYHYGLTFGLTSCNPDNIIPATLPTNPNYLLQRSEYWLAYVDCIAKPRVDSVIAFWVTGEGELKFEIDKMGEQTLQHNIETWRSLYMFFDFGPGIVSLESLGTVEIPRPRRPRRRSSGSPMVKRNRSSDVVAIKQKNSATPTSNQAASSSTQTPRPPPATSPLDICGECKVGEANALLYKCGHLYMCETCARNEHETTQKCPLCHTKIDEVVKVYRV